MENISGSETKTQKSIKKTSMTSHQKSCKANTWEIEDFNCNNITEQIIETKGKTEGKPKIWCFTHDVPKITIKGKKEGEANKISSDSSGNYCLKKQKGKTEVKAKKSNFTHDHQKQHQKGNENQKPKNHALFISSKNNKQHRHRRCKRKYQYRSLKFPKWCTKGHMHTLYKLWSLVI